MEHRWSERINVDMDVLVYEHGIPVSACKAHDISVHGMYIDTSLKYNKHATLVIELSYPGIENNKTSIPASVARTDKNGIGVVLYPSEPEQKEAIHFMCKRESELAMDAVN